MTSAGARGKFGTGGLAAGGANNPQDPWVYLGFTYYGEQPTTGQYVYGGYATGVDRQRLSEAQYLYQKMSDTDRNKFRTQLALTGVDTSGFRDSDYAQAWASYAAQAGNYSLAGKNLTPFDILSMDMRERESAKPKTTTNTQISQNISSYEDVKGAAESIAKSLLGRAPTKEEIKRYQEALNAQERANPTKTVTTTTTQPGGSSTSTSKTSGGLGASAAQGILEDQAKQSQGYAEYQAATTYYNALMQLIGG